MNNTVEQGYLFLKRASGPSFVYRDNPLKLVCRLTCYFCCAAGYMELPDVFRLGFITALANTLIWGVVGTIWWKFLGLY
jgi:hypothetical protein